MKITNYADLEMLGIEYATILYNKQNHLVLINEITERNITFETDITQSIDNITEAKMILTIEKKEEILQGYLVFSDKCTFYSNTEYPAFLIQRIKEKTITQGEELNQRSEERFAIGLLNRIAFGLTHDKQRLYWDGEYDCVIENVSKKGLRIVTERIQKITTKRIGLQIVFSDPQQNIVLTGIVVACCIKPHTESRLMEISVKLSDPVSTFWKNRIESYKTKGSPL